LSLTSIRHHAQDAAPPAATLTAKAVIELPAPREAQAPRSPLLALAGGEERMGRRKPFQTQRCSSAPPEHGCPCQGKALPSCHHPRRRDKPFQLIREGFSCNLPPH